MSSYSTHWPQRVCSRLWLTVGKSLWGLLLRFNEFPELISKTDRCAYTNKHTLYTHALWSTIFNLLYIKQQNVVKSNNCNDISLYLILKSIVNNVYMSISKHQNMFSPISILDPKLTVSKWSLRKTIEKIHCWININNMT